jgi:hypothetical protein
MGAAVTVSKRPPPGFVWRGIAFDPPPRREPDGFYSNAPISIGEDERTADWKVRQTRSTWHARLRIGADRYPGVGATREAALEAAAAEAQNAAAFIVAMLPKGSSPALGKRKRAIKVRR